MQAFEYYLLTVSNYPLLTVMGKYQKYWGENVFITFCLDVVGFGIPFNVLTLEQSIALEVCLLLLCTEKYIQQNIYSSNIPPASAVITAV